MIKQIRLAALTLLLFISLGCAHAAAKQDAAFFLHDGDTVVFYGDSITEQLAYGRDIENYVVTRFPKWHIKFINSGWSGDQASGGGGGPIETRLKRDVLPYKPTVVTLFLGMNDGLYTSYDDKIFQKYAQGITHIVDELQQKLPHVRITLFTPSMFDYAAKDRPERPAGMTGYNYQYPAPDYNQTLIKFSEFIKKLGAERNFPVADLNAPMVEATTRGREADAHFNLAGDGVHPNEIGQLIMASAVLKAWHAPETVAELTLPSGTAATFSVPLPWPLPQEATPAFAVSPLPGSLNLFRVHATDLAEGSYTLMVDGKPAGTASKAQWEAGVDLPWNGDLAPNKQAQETAKLINERILRWHFLYKGGDQAIAHYNDVPTPEEIKALLGIDAWLNDWRTRAHEAAQPKPHTFALRPSMAP